MLALRGNVQGGFVVLENDDIKKYDGRNVIVTILDSATEMSPIELLEQDSFVIPTERGIKADSYVKDLRSDDRV